MRMLLEKVSLRGVFRDLFNQIYLVGGLGEQIWGCQEDLGVINKDLVVGILGYSKQKFRFWVDLDFKQGMLLLERLYLVLEIGGCKS